MPLQVIDQVLDAAHRPLRLNHLEFSQLADVLQVSTTLVVYHEIGVDVFPELLVLGEDGLEDLLLDVFELLGDDGGYPAQEGRD